MSDVIQFYLLSHNCFNSSNKGNRGMIYKLETRLLVGQVMDNDHQNHYISIECRYYINLFPARLGRPVGGNSSISYWGPKKKKKRYRNFFHSCKF